MELDSYTSSGLVISGARVSRIVSSGESWIDTVVRNSAVLRVSGGGYIESTVVMGATLSNCGIASSTVLSGNMTVFNGGSANELSVLRSGKLTVSNGGVATGVSIAPGGIIIAHARGGDSVTRIEGVNESGDFYLSGGTAANFILNSTGQLVASGGAVVQNIELRGGFLTVSSGAVATGIVQEVAGKLTTYVCGGDPNTLVVGTNVSGEFRLSGGVAENCILYENAAQHVSSGGTALHTAISSTWAHQYISSGGVASATSVCFKGSMTIYGGGVASDTTVYSGGIISACGGRISGATVFGHLLVTTATTGADESGGAGGGLTDITIASGGTLTIAANAQFSGSNAIFGDLLISGSNTRVGGLTVSSSGKASVLCGTFTVDGPTWNTGVGSEGKVDASADAVLVNLATVSGAQVNLSSGATIAGTGLEIAANTIRCGGSALGMTATNGVICDLGADGKAYDFAVGGGVIVSGASAAAGERLSALFGATVADMRIASGGELVASSGAALVNATVATGGLLTLDAGAATGERVYFDFAGASSGTLTDMVNDLTLISSDTAICLQGLVDGGVYTVAPDGSADMYVYCMPSGVYDNALCAGESCVDAFAGKYYEFDADGIAVSVTELTVQSFDSATVLDISTELDPDLGIYDRAAVWTDFTATSGAVLNLMEETDANCDAWLTLAGTDLSGATLYGAAAAVDTYGAINLLATSGAVLGNLAAGAGTGGSVDAVKLTLDHATVKGAAYAGGFGDVSNPLTGFIETLVVDAAFEKDFHAGALANYAKTGRHTDVVGDVSLTVKDATFAGNLYGASAVKAGGGESVHNVMGSVNIVIEDGLATKNDFCLYAGGYAIGTAAGDYAYTIENDVSLEIAGGEWGGVAGGRGIFGGIFASGTGGEILGDVNISISGGKMGYVYGGGRSQKNGDSSVGGDVNISISGDADIVYVFGGGSHSCIGNSTTVVGGDVTISVSGGSISGAVYARGQSAGDTVAGAAAVVFSGANDYGCEVYGYTYVGSDDEGATLKFTGYTGTFSGAIGGFNGGIVLGGDTGMTLATAAEDISNANWAFDVSERDAALGGAALLDWQAADFTGTTITLNLTEGEPDEWSLVAAKADTSYGAFDVQIDGASQGILVLDQAISDGDCAGWGFTVENKVLKFKNLAAV